MQDDTHLPRYNRWIGLVIFIVVCLGVCGDCRPVAGDRSDDGGILQMLEDCRVAHGAVSGLGELRQRVELHDLVVECCLT